MEKTREKKSYNVQSCKEVFNKVTESQVKFQLGLLFCLPQCWKLSLAVRSLLPSEQLWLESILHTQKKSSRKISSMHIIQVWKSFWCQAIVFEKTHVPNNCSLTVHSVLSNVKKKMWFFLFYFKCYYSAKFYSHSLQLYQSTRFLFMD